MNERQTYLLLAAAARIQNYRELFDKAHDRFAEARKRGDTRAAAIASKQMNKWERTLSKLAAERAGY